MSFEEAVARRQREAAKAVSRENAELRAEREAASAGITEFDRHMSDLLAYLGRKGIQPCKAYLDSDHLSSMFRTKHVFTPVKGFFVTWRPRVRSPYGPDMYVAEAVLPSGMLWSTGDQGTFHPFIRKDTSLWTGADFAGYAFKVSGYNGTPKYSVSSGHDPATHHKMEDVFASFAERIIKNHAQSLDKRPGR